MSTTPAAMTLPKSYSPSEEEEQVRRLWAGGDHFHADPARTLEGGCEPFCIVIPPPNVTAALHLGHALNNTLQDVLTRYHRMRGFNTLWMPGTDHAGIATQTVVEKRLLQEGKRRSDFTREQFVDLVQEWKDEYEATITEQLKAMGCSCDWPRRRFTMDTGCSEAVREAFFRLFRDDLIYRGKRLVNWDPVTLTALADDEVEMKETAGRMWYLKYPLVRAEAEPGTDETAEHVIVATTRPETMLGDTAVAVNPRDPRAAGLRGAMVRLPIVNRLVPIIEDDYVVLPESMGGDPSDAKAQYATGFLKVTPGHDPNDWEIGLRHDLPVINVLAPDATISRDHGWPDEEFETGQAREAEAYLGLSREEARKRVVQWFDAHDLLAEVRDYTHSVGHSYRSHVPIEPYLSDQWYVRVTDDRLVGEAQRAQAPAQYQGAPPARAHGDPSPFDGVLEFFPPRYAAMYKAWHDNLRDWCISRQLWWGHRIPVWSAEDVAGEVVAAWQERARAQPDRVAVRGDEQRLFVCIGRCTTGADAGLEAQAEAEGLAQDEDVLDTWFSSALWPISTMGWPDPQAVPGTEGLLEVFNPTTVLCTARDIITLWVSRMVMFTRYFHDRRLPFRHVYIHPMIQDGHGQRMSKSLGNGVDPRDIIHSHGADGMRFPLVQLATSTQDSRLPVDMVCPHCDHAFHPREITSGAGYRVAAPRQECPACGRSMVSGYGAASGEVVPDADAPAARNTSAKFDIGRNFANKLWNAARFAIGHLEGDLVEQPPRAEWDRALSLADRWIITRVHRTLHAIEDALAEYQFNVYAEQMYDLTWRDFCDWYLEAIKPTVARSPAQQQVLRTVLNTLVRMLHPICPLVTEALWPHVQAAGPAGLDGIVLPGSDVLAGAAWPDVACSVDDADAAATFERAQQLVSTIRTLRGSHGVAGKRMLHLMASAGTLELIEAAGGIVEHLAGLESAGPLPAETPEDAVAVTFEGEAQLLAGLRDGVDSEAEQARLGRLVEEKTRAVDGFRRKLENRGYVEKAPPEVVEETRRRLAEAEADLEAARRTLEDR